MQKVLTYFFQGAYILLVKRTCIVVLRQDRYYEDDKDGHSFYGNYDLDFYRDNGEFEFGEELGLQGSQNINYSMGTL